MTGTDIRELFDRAVEPLDTMPDAVPEVLVKGHRSVRLRRAATAAGTLAGAAAGVAAVIGVTSLAGGAATEPPAAGSGTSATAPATAPTKVTSSTSRPRTGRTASAPATPPALVTFNRDVVAPALDRALPNRFGTVSLNKSVGEFIIKGDKTYELQFAVSNRPVGYPQQIFRCSQYTDPAPGEPDRFPTCTERTLPDGMRAVAITEDIDQTAGNLEALRALTIYRDKLVELSLYPSETKPRTVPISRAEMLDALADTDLAAAYHRWATHPGWTS